MIKYNDAGFQNFIESFDIINDDIYNSLKAINTEFEKMENVLNTPKSTCEIPKIITYLREQLDLISSEKALFLEEFRFTKDEYNNSVADTNMMVGDNK